MTAPVQVPADVDREDQVLGPLTARQLLIVVLTATAVYGLWRSLGPIHLIWFLAASTPLSLAGLALAVGRRDGMSLDRLLLAALAHRATVHSTPRTTRPDRQEAAGSDGVGRSVSARAPVRGVRPVGPDRLGVVDLGSGGAVVVCAVSALNLSLRSAAEQRAAVAGFARWLHSLSGPVQLLSRTRPLDLSVPIARLHTATAHLPHPALARAARAHAAHLHALDTHAELLDHEFLIVFRHPTPTHAGDRDRAGDRVSVAGEALRRRAGEAVAMLTPIGLRVVPLTAAEVAAVVRRATRPTATPPPGSGSGCARPPLDPPTVEIPRPAPPPRTLRCGRTGCGRTRGGPIRCGPVQGMRRPMTSTSIPNSPTSRSRKETCDEVCDEVTAQPTPAHTSRA